MKFDNDDKQNGIAEGNGTFANVNGAPIQSCVWKTIYDFVKCKEEFNDIKSKLYVFEQIKQHNKKKKRRTMNQIYK